jgi:hypothetical protein
MELLGNEKHLSKNHLSQDFINQKKSRPHSQNMQRKGSLKQKE